VKDLNSSERQNIKQLLSVVNEIDDYLIG